MDDLRGHGEGIVEVEDLGQDDDELVAADARDEVLVAHLGLDASARLDDQLVAGGVPVGVVDVLQAVEVGEEDGHAAATAPAVGEHHAHPDEQLAAVQQLGERVMRGHEPQRLA